jgi:hypothetical protein
MLTSQLFCWYSSTSIRSFSELVPDINEYVRIEAITLHMKVNWINAHIILTLTFALCMDFHLLMRLFENFFVFM